MTLDEFLTKLETDRVPFIEGRAGVERALLRARNVYDCLGAHACPIEVLMPAASRHNSLAGDHAVRFLGLSERDMHIILDAADGAPFSRYQAEMDMVRARLEALVVAG